MNKTTETISLIAGGAILLGAGYLIGSNLNIQRYEKFIQVD